MNVGQLFKRSLWAATCLVASPLMSLADPPADDRASGAGRCDMGMHAPGRPPGPPGAEDRPPPFLMDLDLTEDQQDKVFAIMHAAAPAVRDREKAARKARDALHQLAHAPSFSESSANSLAQAQGTADSQLALLRTKMEHDVYAVLSPEQQSKLTSREKEFDCHGRGGPPHDGPPRG